MSYTEDDKKLESSPKISPKRPKTADGSPHGGPAKSLEYSPRKTKSESTLPLIQSLLIEEEQQQRELLRNHLKEREELGRWSLHKQERDYNLQVLLRRQKEEQELLLQKQKEKRESKLQKTSLSPLEKWIKKIYTGKPDRRTDPEEIMSMMDRGVPIISGEAGTFQLEFLYLCASNELLQQPPKYPLRWVNPALLSSSGGIPLGAMNPVSDYLKVLFFTWMDRKYPDPERFLEQQPPGSIYRQNYEYNKIQRFNRVLVDHYADSYEEDKLVISSMLATIYPFIKRDDGRQAYDICGSDAALYEHLHAQAPYPYFRFGGDFKGRRFFTGNYFGADARGIDVSGIHMYSPYYDEILREHWDISNEELLKHHANFQGADIRSANFSGTVFKLQKSVLNVRRDIRTNTAGSNIDQLVPRMQPVRHASVDKLQPRNIVSSGIKLLPPVNFDDLEDPPKDDKFDFYSLKECVKDA